MGIRVAEGGVVEVVVEVEGGEVFVRGAGYGEGVGGDEVRIPDTPEPHTGPGME